MRKCICKHPRPRFETHTFMQAKTGEYSKSAHTHAFKCVCNKCSKLIGWFKTKQNVNK